MCISTFSGIINVSMHEDTLSEGAAIIEDSLPVVPLR